MKVAWYNIGIKKNEWIAKGIPQEVLNLDLEDLGEKEIVLINGFNFSVIFEGDMLTPDLNGRNPFYKEKTSCYVDPETSEIWVGIVENENNL